MEKANKEIKQGVKWEEYILLQYADNTVGVFYQDEKVPKGTKTEHLRKIAKKINLAIDENWRTGQLGRNVIKEIVAKLR